MKFNISTAVLAFALAAAPMTVLAQAASPSGADVQALPGGIGDVPDCIRVDLLVRCEKCSVHIQS